MMGKAKSCIGGFSIFNYVIDEKKGFELSRNGVCGETPLEIFQEFKIMQDQNQTATKKLFSLVLSPTIADGEKLTKKELRELVKDYLEDLGFDTTLDQFIAFCHLEKKHRHIHILLNRVGQNSKLKKDAFIGKKAQWAAHRVAEKHELTSAKQMMIDKIKAAEKPPLKLERMKIYEKHLAVMKDQPTSFSKYSKMMENLGVKFKPTLTKKNELQGFRVENLETGEEFKASDIHKSMSLKNLLEAGLPVENEISLHANLIKAQKNALVKAETIEQNKQRLQETTLLQKEKETTANYTTYFKR